jgi:hypothetical protein
MFLLNVFLYFTDGSQKTLTFIFDEDMIEITEDDILKKLFLFISKTKWRTLSYISCESAYENTNNIIKYPRYIDSFDV